MKNDRQKALSSTHNQNGKLKETKPVNARYEVGPLIHIEPLQICMVYDGVEPRPC